MTSDYPDPSFSGDFLPVERVCGRMDLSQSKTAIIGRYIFILIESITKQAINIDICQISYNFVI